MRKSYLVAAGVLFLVLGAFVAAGRWWNGVSSKIFVVSPEGQSQAIIKNPLERNILLLGYGGGTHDGPNLTDSMMVVHLDPAKARATLISIPRDLWVNIPNAATSSNWEKINAAYADGVAAGGAAEGGKMAEQAVAAVTGLPIDNFVALDFAGFVNTIDTIGGVEVNVQTAFEDPQYPIEGKENDLCGKSPTDLAAITASASATTDPETIFPCRYEDLKFAAGWQQMDGATALKYVRSRHSLQDGTDFGRAARQRNLLLAVKQKVLAINFVPRIIPFVTSLGDDIKTDLSPGDTAAFVQNAASLAKYKIVNLALTDQNYLNDTFSADGQAILVPKAGQDNFGEIKNWLADQINLPNPKDPAVVLVQNGTSTTGLAQSAITQLKNRGVETLPPMNAAEQTASQTTLTVYGGNVDEENLASIREVLGNPTVINASADAGLKYNVLVVLGSDFGRSAP